MPVDPMRAKSLFLAAADLADPVERAAYLERECGGMADLRARVEALLRADAAPLPEPGPADATGTFVADAPASALPTGTFAPVAPAPAPTAEHLNKDERAGAVIVGKYTLVEPIGEGGMGSVWRARQTEPVKRYVAVKLIKAGMDSKQVLARFEAERQALALMDHPNIAKVLDGGLHDGRPFFVMELVKGVPITDFCDHQKLTPKERLELFVPVCQAIQHAHQKGIIHRDVKPSNVLIALYDDKPVVKVIDFGVAKATGVALTERTIDTGFGGVVGTPQYMSPEQATFNNLDVDTRSDVYSLGVLLYELLTGTPPFSKKELEKKGLLEILRVVREEEPARPSTKLSTADALPTLSANRGTEPKKLTGLLRNELDWIVMKALEKDRSRRYETANGFASDVLRFLSGEAVQAHPPSTSYRLKKFVRRNKGQVIAASLVVFALLVGVMGTTWGLIEAKRQEQEARRQEQIARAETSEKEKARQAEAERAEGERRAKLEAETRRAEADEQKRRAEAGEKLAVEQKIRAEAGEKLAGERLMQVEAEKKKAESAALAEKKAKEAEAAQRAKAEALANAEKTAKEREAAQRTKAEKASDRTREVLDAMVSGVTGDSLSTQKAITDEQKRFLGGVLGYYQDFAGEKADDQKTRARTAHAAIRVGLIEYRLGRKEEGVVAFRTARDGFEKLAAEFSNVPDYRQDLASSHNNLGILLAELGKRAEAEEQFRKGLAIQEKLADQFPNVPQYRKDLASSHDNLGILLASLGKRAEADEQYKKALAIEEKLVTEFPNVPDYRRNLANSHNNLGALQAGLGRRAEAEEQYKKALAIREKLIVEFPVVPDYRQEIAKSHNSLGNLLADLGKHVEAEEQLKKALAFLEKLTAEFPNVPEYRVDLAVSHYRLGSLLADLGKHVEAEEQYKKGLVIREKLANEFPNVLDYRKDVAVSHTGLGLLLADLGKLAEAEVQHKKGLVIEEKLAAKFPNVPEYQVNLGGSYCNLGRLVRNGGKAADSLAWFQKAIDVLRPVHEKEPRDVMARLFLRNSHAGRAMAYYRLEKYAEAVKDWDRAVELTDTPQQPMFRTSRAVSKVQAGQVAEAVAEMTELTKKSSWPADQWYNFARVYAVASTKVADKKQEYADRAMELLRRAVKAGYKDATRVKQDKDLDSLRDRDDFKKLLVELEKPTEPKK